MYTYENMEGGELNFYMQQLFYFYVIYNDLNVLKSVVPIFYRETVGRCSNMREYLLHHCWIPEKDWVKQFTKSFVHQVFNRYFHFYVTVNVISMYYQVYVKLFNNLINF